VEVCNCVFHLWNTLASNSVSNTMKHSPAWEAANSAASQKIPWILCNLRVYYHVHVSLPLVLTPNQTNPIHALTHCFFIVCFNIILSSMPRSYRWSVSLMFPHHSIVWTSLLLHMCHMPNPSYSSWFYHPNIVWWGVQLMGLLIMQYPPGLCYTFPCGPKYLPHHSLL